MKKVERSLLSFGFAACLASMAGAIDMPQIVSHRGESQDRPENTMAAFRLAFAREVDGVNPGAGRVRMALVAEPAECLEAARRIVDFCRARA